MNKIVQGYKVRYEPLAVYLRNYFEFHDRFSNIDKFWFCLYDA